MSLFINAAVCRVGAHLQDLPTQANFMSLPECTPYPKSITLLLYSTLKTL